MEQIDDAGLFGRNPCIFDAVNAHGRLAALASNPELTRISETAS